MRRDGMNMCEGPLLKKMIVYAIPIMLTQILQLLFNAADLVVVGRYCGSITVAAIGATASLTNLMINLFFGLAVGVGVVVAQNLGAENGMGVHRAVHTSIPLALIGGVFLTVFALLFSERFLELMGTPKNVLPLATPYIKIYFCGMIPNLVYNFGASILRAAGDTRSPLVYLTIAGVANVIFNLFFVLVLGMNVAGVALATTISQAVSAALVLIALFRRSDACRLELKSMKIHLDSLKAIARIGLPAGIQGSLFSISNVIIQSSLNSFGPIAMSGNAAAVNIEGFTYTAMNAMYQTTLNFVGQNSGAKKYDRVNRSLKIGLLVVLVVGIITGGATRLFGRPLLGIYITDSPKAIEYGLNRMNYVALLYFVCGMMEVTTGALRGLGVSLAPMIASVLGVCGVRIIWLYTVFVAYRTLSCLYLSYLVSWVFTLIVQLIAYRIVMNKIQKKNAV